jgi:hypothetical protein
MRRTVVVAVAVSALVAAIAGSGTAMGRARPTSVTLKLTSKLDKASYVDNAPTGRSAGDILVFTEKLFGAHGKAAGSDAASCVYLFDATSSLCTGTYSVHGGQIMVQLLQPGPTGVYTQAITGGTGTYAGATGTVTVSQATSGDRFTFHVKLPAN